MSHQNESTALGGATEVVTQSGFKAMAAALQTPLDVARPIERRQMPGYARSARDVAAAVGVSDRRGDQR